MTEQTTLNIYLAVAQLLFDLEEHEVTSAHIAHAKDIVLAKALGASKSKCDAMIEDARYE